MVKRYSDLYLDARRALLSGYGQEQAGFVARLLLCAASGKSQEAILANRDKFAGESVCDTMESWTLRAVAGEPLAYILGQWEFYGMTLEVNSHVLIPRDDTMAVAELAVRQTLMLEHDPRVLDLCTGSGCIGLAIANQVKDVRVTLADISREALAVAKKNTVAHKLTGRVSCVQMDVTQTAPAFLGQFDLIVSNPPYVTSAEMLELEPSVRNFEPSLALDGGADGLDFYRDIVKNFKDSLKPGGFFCFEFGMGQGNDVCRILKEAGFQILEVKKDYSEIDRAVLAQKIREEEMHRGEQENSL